MNNPIGMLFPDFTGVRSLDWLSFVARLGGKKYRSEARMIFFRPTALRADRLAQKTQSKTFAWQKRKNIVLYRCVSFSPVRAGYKKGCKPFGLHPSCTYILLSEVISLACRHGKSLPSPFLRGPPPRRGTPPV